MQWNRPFAKLYRDGRGARAADEALEPKLPYPDGWFCLAMSAEIKPGAKLTRQLMGEDLVLVRTASGRLSALRAYCPHLGAHLGISGVVEREEIRCNFHNLSFDLNGGACLRTTDGCPPPKASLTGYPVMETGGAVFVWRSRKAAEPEWELPDLPAKGWREPAWHRFDMASHPQQIMENVFDSHHIAQLHGVTQHPPNITFDDTRVTLEFVTDWPLIAGKVLSLPASATVYGMSMLLLHFDLPRPRLKFRVMVLPTPIAPWRIHVRVVTTVTQPALPRMLRPLEHWTAQLIQQLALLVNVNDFNADLATLHYQEYQAQPRLVAADQYIGKYRKWAERFYEIPEGLR
ncbi:Rieske 2Fe-2S domain-containing protein [Streptomyces sp. NBC_01092]|uniref:Rieske 2Fe-2S domain-containing protein n=1 Tax=Streptomyces sp. NBC_01092 TaxID=2903748 RepID=UPI00386DC2CF|nr:Rieske 2Fe-2S domain-containing protein [Streptomyces sp. NBC_01092]